MSGHKRAQYLKNKEQIDDRYRKLAEKRRERKKAKAFLKTMFEFALKEVRR